MDQNNEYKREIKSRDECDEIMRKIEEQCKTHKYFKKIVVDELERILNDDAQRCDGCLQWNFDNNMECLNCKEDNETENDKTVNDKPNRKVRRSIERENKVKKRKCKGVCKSGKVCYFNVTGDVSNYCDSHKYFESLTTEELENIKNGLAKPCIRCSKFHFELTAQCSYCTKYSMEFSKIKKALIKKCGWKDRHMNNCRAVPLDDTDFCKNHQYVIDYTDEMKNESKLCKGCNKVKYLSNGCDVCKERSLKHREIHKQTKNICMGFVDGVPCVFEALENGYCGKHQRQLQKIEIERDGTKRVCSNFNRDVLIYLILNMNIIIVVIVEC